MYWPQKEGSGIACIFKVGSDERGVTRGVAAPHFPQAASQTRQHTPFRRLFGLFGGFPRCLRYSVPVLGNLRYFCDTLEIMRGSLMAGVVATSLHPANLVHIAKWTQTFRGARIACASWHPLSTPLHFANPAPMSVSPQATK